MSYQPLAPVTGPASASAVAAVEAAVEAAADAAADAEAAAHAAATVPGPSPDSAVPPVVVSAGAPTITPTVTPAVVPVGAYEPPYYAVVFTSVKTEAAGGGHSAYGETAERMEERVKEIPGYLGMDHAGSPGGLSITVGYFRDADALEKWRSDVEHRAAQRRGRAEWYERYTLHVAKVERSYGFERGHG